MNPGIIPSLNDHIGHILLNRPEQHNAINKEMWQALPQAMAQLQQEGARCVVISGEGDDFSSGANTAEAAKLTSFDEAREHWHAIRDSLCAVYNFELPTIAMIHGVCFGGGCLLASACDLRVASEESNFAVPVARLGLALDDTTVARLVELVGPANAKKLLLLGDSINASEAYHMGLVNTVVPAANLKTTTDTYAKRICANVSSSVISCKKSINRIACKEAFCPEDNDKEVVSAFISQVFQDKLKSRRSDKS
ncbi:MAG TPA: enoyl-CoA hydratase/isomerase family protein [Drouetiella sp.]